MRLAILIAAFAGAAVIGAPALAHSGPMSAVPAANSALSLPSRLQLQFSERLVGQFSGVSLTMTTTPGMTMKAPVKMPGATTLSADGLRSHDGDAGRPAGHAGAGDGDVRAHPAADACASGTGATGRDPRSTIEGMADRE